MSPPETTLIGSSRVNSAVSQSFPPLVILPVLFEESSGSVESSNDAPPTPLKGSSLSKLTGNPTGLFFQK